MCLRCGCTKSHGNPFDHDPSSRGKDDEIEDELSHIRMRMSHGNGYHLENSDGSDVGDEEYADEEEMSYDEYLAQEDAEWASDDDHIDSEWADEGY
jgi:hypothetical protein